VQHRAVSLRQLSFLSADSNRNLSFSLLYSSRRDCCLVRLLCVVVSGFVLYSVYDTVVVRKRPLNPDARQLSQSLNVHRIVVVVVPTMLSY